jgi:hypothetical protein
VLATLATRKKRIAISEGMVLDLAAMAEKVMKAMLAMGRRLWILGRGPMRRGRGCFAGFPDLAPWR